MQDKNHNHFSTIDGFSASTLVSIFAFFLVFILLPCGVFPAALHAAEPFEMEIDANETGFLEKNRFSAPVIGFTDIVPPTGIRQQYTTEERRAGYFWRLAGVELSLWQLAEIPANARYLLNWDFTYEGKITEGRGRTGFVFGNPEGANLLAVEMTYHGTLRLVRWGKQLDKNRGDIVWSRKMADSGTKDIRIDASYDIRRDTLTCRVNGGQPVTIELGRYMRSAPLTIRGAGFFAAVPEAVRVTRSFHPRSPEREIDMSRKTVGALHTHLRVRGK